jgi:hypothetical protein
MRYFFIVVLLFSGVELQAQTNNFPETGNVTIGSGHLYQTGIYNLQTQGAIKLKNYLLLDSDGDWTGGDYFIIQDDATGDFLRIGRGFNNNLIIGSNGYVGIGTTTPDFKLDINGSLRLGKDDDTGLSISRFTSALTDVPGSIDGILFRGPMHSHVVFDIQGNDSNDGFYIRVPDVLQVSPTVNTTAFVVKANGNVGIGTTLPAYKLDVDGIVRAEEVKVQTVPASDYVFESDYNLLPLQEVESFIQQNKHLPDIPSAEEFKEKGVGLGEMDDLLLRKIEELTLYMIQMKQEVEQLKAENKQLKQKILD